MLRFKEFLNEDYLVERRAISDFKSAIKAAKRSANQVGEPVIILRNKKGQFNTMRQSLYSKATPQVKRNYTAVQRFGPKTKVSRMRISQDTSPKVQKHKKAVKSIQTVKKPVQPTITPEEKARQRSERIKEAARKRRIERLKNPNYKPKVSKDSRAWFKKVDAHIKAYDERLRASGHSYATDTRKSFAAPYGQ